VGYFSAEFGLHESLPVYSGGLGILAGDHIKSASDLGIPLVGIGLFYAQGYFRQRLDLNGWQQEEYLMTDVNQLAREPAIGKSGGPVTVQIETRGGAIRDKVWRVKVGRCDLLMLDSDVEGNTGCATEKWRSSHATSLPVVFKAAVEEAASEGNDGVGAPNCPEHPRLFES
jgi:glycogen phosphorylase